LTVKELIEELKDMPQDAEIIMQKDAEGNGYSPLSVVDLDAIYVPDSTWSGDVYSLDWTAGDCCLDEEEWEEMKANHPRCVVLAPIN